MNNAAVFSDHVGIPFVDRGRDLNGVDCWGLAVLVYRAAGIQIPEYNEYGDICRRERAELARIIDENRSDWKEVSRPQSLDLVLIRINGQASHIAVMVDSVRMLNITREGESAIESTRSVQWCNRIVGYFRYVG